MGQESKLKLRSTNWDSKVEGRTSKEFLRSEDWGKGRHSGMNLERQRVFGRKNACHIYSVRPRPLPYSQVDSWRTPFANAACDDRGDIDYLLLILPHL